MPARFPFLAAAFGCAVAGTPAGDVHDELTALAEHSQAAQAAPAGPGPLSATAEVRIERPMATRDGRAADPALRDRMRPALRRDPDPAAAARDPDRLEGIDVVSACLPLDLMERGPAPGALPDTGLQTRVSGRNGRVLHSADESLHFERIDAGARRSLTQWTSSPRPSVSAPERAIPCCAPAMAAGRGGTGPGTWPSPRACRAPLS